MMENSKMNHIPKEKFNFVQRDAQISDEKLQTKTVGYLGDAWNRFRTNKSAVVAFILIMILLKTALKNSYVQAVLRGLKPCIIGIILAKQDSVFCS